jgi:hypothetical protein
MSWNNSLSYPSWSGIPTNNRLTLTVSSINTNHISVGQLSVPSSMNIKYWSSYPAISTVHGSKDPFTEANITEITDFKSIEGDVIRAKLGTGLSGIVEADLMVVAPTGDLDYITTGKINVGSGSGEINIEGSSLAPGDSALYVAGGTTLTADGLTHGVHIGALTVADVDTQRIDVLPSGIDIISPTYITIDSAAVANVAAGATLSLAAGGTLSLAGGAYIEYNSDEHNFVNTSAGNDFTDMRIGNIHGANYGSQPFLARAVEAPRSVGRCRAELRALRAARRCLMHHQLLARGAPYNVGRSRYRSPLTCG